jgi:hypothetical protein
MLYRVKLESSIAMLTEGYIKINNKVIPIQITENQFFCTISLGGESDKYLPEAERYFRENPKMLSELLEKGKIVT